MSLFQYVFVLFLSLFQHFDAAKVLLFFDIHKKNADFYSNLQFLVSSQPQKVRLGQHLETAYPTLIRMLGEEFHSVVLRMAVHIERIAMILTALRMTSGECHSPEMEEKSRILFGKTNEALSCSDEDYQTAEMVGNKLICIWRRHISW